MPHFFAMTIPRALALAFCLLVLPGVASSSSIKEQPVNVVVGLYRDYAFESVIDDPVGDYIWGQSAKVWAKYFAPTMVQLYVRIRMCDRKFTICAPELDPIWNSGDPSGATGVEIKARATPNVIDVTIHWPSAAVNPGPDHLVYRLVKVGSVWRISDIEYSDGSTLAGRLKRSLAENHM